jgi:hypothetical protein
VEKSDPPRSQWLTARVQAFFAGLKSNVMTAQNTSPQCPYCVLGGRHRPMTLQDIASKEYVCGRCGHTENEGDPTFQCSCSSCNAAA